MPLSFSSEQKQTWLWLSVGLALAALLVLLGPVLAPFIAGAILAYALNPAVDRLDAKRIGRFSLPRTVAVTIVLLLFVAAILAVFLIVVPILQKEIPLLQEKIPRFLSRFNETVAPWLLKFGIDVPQDSAGLGKMISERFATSGDEIWSAVFASAKAGGLAVLGWFGTMLLIPVVLFYLLLDWHRVLALFEGIVPRRWAARAASLAREADGLLAQYLRGQLSVMLTLAVYYSVGLAIAGFDVALPVGILTGLLVFIPYLGFGLGLLLALIAALLQFDGMYGLVAVAIVYGLGQVLESFVLTPRLVGERIGLHPLAVIFALMAFGQLFGFAGVLLALPASAIVSVAVKHLRAHYINSSFYKQS
ncbi:MAG TPA: AI-2E family transporter [Paucimonas sp.]|nr:AI-2E family transporter [Paucimonas sp.]